MLRGFFRSISTVCLKTGKVKQPFETVCNYFSKTAFFTSAPIYINQMTKGLSKGQKNRILMFKDLLRIVVGHSLRGRFEEKKLEKFIRSIIHEVFSIFHNIVSHYLAYRFLHCLTFQDFFVRSYLLLVTNCDITKRVCNLVCLLISIHQFVVTCSLYFYVMDR